jgi:hypothetical protein
VSHLTVIATPLDANVAVAEVVAAITVVVGAVAGDHRVDLTALLRVVVVVENP